MRRKLLILVWNVSILGSLATVYQMVALLFTHWLFDRDYSQTYLMGRALRAGVYIYEPIPELAKRFEPTLGNFLQHPSAYPPIVALIGVPLSMLPYFWSVVIWSLWELGCLFVATLLIFRHFGGRRASTPVLITLGVFLAWQPIMMDLFRGQVMLTILLLLTLTWLAFRSNQDVRAGIFLGLSLSLKFYGWPILLLFLLKRRWKAALAGATVVTSCNLLMAVWLGMDVLRDYFLNVAPGIAQLWIPNVYNFSVLSFGYRLLGEPGRISFLIVTLCICMLATFKARDLDHSFMVMLAASTILAPISWIHYFVTLLPALCLVASREEFAPSEALLGLLIAVILFLGYIPLEKSAIWGTLPLFGLTGLIWLLQKPPVRSVRTQFDDAICEAA